MDDNSKVNGILHQIERKLKEYPEFADDLEREPYYCSTLMLTKSEMLLIKKSLENDIPPEESGME